MEQAIKDILLIPFDENGDTANWKKYLLAVRDYCFEGNVDVDWRGQDNPKRKWVHVPWQHAGEKGREGINGLTREATAKPRQLASTQKDPFQTYAVALYNPPGGYTIGKVWENQFEPDPNQARFPEGTVVAKVLFTQADESQVPYLKNPLSWKAYAQDPVDGKKRKVQELRLIQMDIMIRDNRAKNTGGWVFGTFCYNGDLNEKNRWHNLMPVGLQWGNDPQVDDPNDNPENKEPIETRINPKLKETVVSRDPKLPPQHLGWGGRLNGPADYYRSSCMSCHATAQYPSVVQQHPDFDDSIRFNPGDPQWSAWFRNLNCGQPFSPMFKYDKRRAISVDFSLQLAIGLEQFYAWKARTMGGYFTPVLPGGPRPDERVQRSVPTSEPVKP
jgi:hypothetical protein